MTPIDLLLSLELPDASIARRLRVDRRTIGRWRVKSCEPLDAHQKTALAYLNEILQKITSVTLATAFHSKAA
jgi:hypothetical protein